MKRAVLLLFVILIAQTRFNLAGKSNHRAPYGEHEYEIYLKGQLPVKPDGRTSSLLLEGPSPPLPPGCPQHIGPPCPRNYNNTMKDYQPGDNVSLPDQLREQMTTMMLTYVDIITTNYLPNDTSLGSFVMTGTAGQAVMFLRLYKNFRNAQYLDLAEKYIAAALQNVSPTPTGDVGFLESYTGVYTIASIIYAELGDTTNSQKYIGLMKIAIKDCLKATDDTFDTGRSGLLMAAKMLNNYFGEGVISNSDILTMAYQILQNGITTGSEGHLAWKNTVYPDIIFWGQGHGSTGVLQQLMDIPELISNTTAALYLRNTLDYYLTLQLPDGNFPTPQIPPYPPAPDTLVQWCHGAPAFMPVLTLGSVIFSDASYLQAADRASDSVWERGLLTKGLMLCHGVSGNTYMFLYMYRYTQNPKYLYRAIKFQEFTLNTDIMSSPSKMRVPSPSPYMFFDGSYSGAVVLWSDMLRGDNYYMPGFEPFP